MAGYAPAGEESPRGGLLLVKSPCFLMGESLSVIVVPTNYHQHCIQANRHISTMFCTKAEYALAKGLFGEGGGGGDREGL
jgi:hypothetical protein